MLDVASPSAADLRRMMVDCQVRPFDVTDQAVLGIMLAVPRERFVGAQNAAIACSDAVLTVKGAGESRRLLTPMVLARLIQAANLTPASRVLDVAGGAGYSAAVLAGLCAHVVALESDAGLTAQARANCEALGLANVEAVTGSLAAGLPAKGPFDVILVNGAVESGLEGLIGNLAPGGRLLAIRREPGQSGLAGKATRYDVVAGVRGARTLFDAAGSILPGFARKAAFSF